jgi:hypothetical protein
MAFNQMINKQSSGFYPFDIVEFDVATPSPTFLKYSWFFGEKVACHCGLNEEICQFWAQRYINIFIRTLWFWALR